MKYSIDFYLEKQKEIQEAIFNGATPNEVIEMQNKAVEDARQLEKSNIALKVIDSYDKFIDILKTINKLK